MNDLKDISAHLSDGQVLDLVRRLELRPQLLRRLLEEQITALVPIDQAWMEQEKSRLLGENKEQEWCAQRDWTSEDLELHLWRPEALRRFADSASGPVWKMRS